MKNYNKYKRQYFAVKKPKMDWAKKEYVDTVPIWCSVDLRDGNQSLTVPMTLVQKLEFFNLIVKTGFKEIEIGFPASSDTEFAFCRKLIEEKLIPDDVTIQVLTQARQHIVERTFEALDGVKNAIVHVYNSTSKAQREQVFNKSKKEILNIAVNGAKMLVDCAKKTKGNFKFEYSPESFTGTEPDFALEVCNAVLDIFKPTSDKKAIINLPATVEHSLPHVFANQIEYMSQNLKYRKNVIVSLHNHNDRGTAVAATELGLLAGADRVEGTFFGNGERTGNVDIITVALNMYSMGINPQLDFSHMSDIVSLYESTTGLKVPDRSPYSGDLVFCAFSGSHQDAIAKGLAYKEKTNTKEWTIPYLPLDPSDVGRELETSVIRINSQSGKGGIGYVLEKFGYNLPPLMREAVGYSVKNESDTLNKELSNDEVLAHFEKNFLDIEEPFTFMNCSFIDRGPIGNRETIGKFEIYMGIFPQTLKGRGNGKLDSLINSLNGHVLLDRIKIDDLIYSQHALDRGSNAKAISYIGLKINNKYHWGAGTDFDLSCSSFKAVISAINNGIKQGKIKHYDFNSKNSS